MLQGFFAFVLGGIVTAVVIANQPQLLDDVRLAMADVRLGAKHFVKNDDDVSASLLRRFEDRGHDGYDDWRRDGDANTNDTYSGARREDEAYGNSQAPSEYDRYGADYSRGNDPRTADNRGPTISSAVRECRATIAFENRADHAVSVRLQPQGYGDKAFALENSSAPITLSPGAREVRDVRALGDCNRLNESGAVTLAAEICPLDGEHRSDGCRTSDLAVEPARDVAESSVPDRRSSVPHG